MIFLGFRFFVYCVHMKLMIITYELQLVSFPVGIVAHVIINTVGFVLLIMCLAFCLLTPEKTRKLPVFNSVLIKPRFFRPTKFMNWKIPCCRDTELTEYCVKIVWEILWWTLCWVTFCKISRSWTHCDLCRISSLLRCTHSLHENVTSVNFYSR